VGIGTTRRPAGLDARIRYHDTVASCFGAPLLVVEDLLIARRGVILLPAVRRDGLHLAAGDSVDLLQGETRIEVKILALEPDADPACVRLRVEARPPFSAGVEVWRSQVESGVVASDSIAEMRRRRRASGV
jgi:hypothetical protein